MAKNMLKESRAISNTQERGIYILGWASLIIAAVGGAYAAEAWIGDWLRSMLGWAPDGWHLPELLLFVGFVAFVIDLIADLTPNRPALYFVILAPTVATAAGGKLASRISDWSNALQDGVGGRLAEWVGAASASILAIIAIAASLLMARRVLAKQAAAAGMR